MHRLEAASLGARRLRLGRRRLRRRRGAPGFPRRHGGSGRRPKPAGARPRTSSCDACRRQGVAAAEVDPRCGRSDAAVAPRWRAATSATTPTTWSVRSGRCLTADATLPAVAVDAAGRLGRSARRHVPRRRAAAATFEPVRARSSGAVRRPSHERRVRLAGRAQRRRRSTRTRRSLGSSARATARELRFAGLVLAPGLPRQRRAEAPAAEAARRSLAGLGADGVVCTTFSSGNSHTDTMLTVRACERPGHRHRGARVRDERRPHRPRARGGLPRQHRQRGRARRRVDTRARDRRRRARPHRRSACPPCTTWAACVADRRRPLDGGARMTVVHYLNQFFAGLGGEEAAGHEPVRLDGPAGPGPGAGRRGARASTSRSRAATTASASTRPASLAHPARLARGAPARRARSAARRSGRGATATPAACSHARPAVAGSRWSPR